MHKKTCRGPCGRPLDVTPENFSRDATKLHGVRNVCRVCDAERRANAHEAIRTAKKWPAVAAFDASEQPDHVVEDQQGAASVPLMITQAMRQRLRELDVDDEDVAEMTPAMARHVIREREKEQRDAEKRRREREARQRRLASDFAPVYVEDFEDDDAAMEPGDFDSEFGTAISNSINKIVSNKGAAKEKRQEFNEKMGEFATSLRDAAAIAPVVGNLGESIPGEHAEYIRKLAEQERRFGNRRFARSIAIQQAHEQLARESMMYVAETFFRNKVEPVGYARFPKPETPARRTASVLLSDLHLGSELDSLDEPVTFKATEEARRLEWILRQFIDFKPQYRDVTEALVILNGDVIEGDLQHDIRSGSPLTEQMAIFWQYFTHFIGYVAAHYKSVRVVCQPGNHGRNKLRHPGRATASKWDGFEWALYYSLMMMCSELKNVAWHIPFRAISVVDVHGQILGVTHADTELKLGHPDTKAKENNAQLSKINSTMFYGVRFDGFAFGHYHTGRFHPGSPSVIWNSALVPPNGHARTSGYGIGEPCGQFIWESVEGHLFGDLRFIEVGRAQDKDERLGSLIKPFRFSMLESQIPTVFAAV